MKIIIPIFFALILLTGTSGVTYDSAFAQTQTDPPRQETASPSDNNGNKDRVITGQLQIIWSHPNPNISSDFNPVKKYFLGGDESYELVGFEGAAIAHGGALKMNGKDITVRGVPDTITGKLIVKGIERAGNGSSGDDSHVYAASTTGSQKWATLPCKFADNSSEPRDLAYFVGLLDYTDTFWREASYDTINLDGSVELDWKTLPQPGSYYVSGNIKHTLIAQDCAAVHDADVNFPDFDGINFILNEALDCCAWGGGVYLNIDGQGKDYDATWMPPWAFNHMDILAHEMGHGFGLPHSSGPYSSTYDSQWDIMSGGGTCIPQHPDFGCIGVHTVSWHKDVLGWIDASDVYVDDTTLNQVVFIERLAEPINASDPNVYQVVKIPTSSSNEFYTLEVRKYAGFDNIGKIPGEAVVIHKVDTTLTDRNAQVVVNPFESSGTNGPGSQWITGEIYQFPGTNTSVLIGDMANDGFTITLNPTGGNIPPQVTITSPANGSTFTVGNSVSFAGTATDDEDGNISATLSWTSDLDGTIGSGASFNTSSLQVGTHIITADVTDSGSLSDSDTITITIDPVPNDPPTANADAGTVDEGLVVNIDLASNDTDSDGTIEDTSIVISSSPANGSISVNANGTVDYTHDGSETISDIFEYTIDDNDGATSNAATVSISVNPVNDTPTVIITSPSNDSSHSEGDSVSFSGSAQDAEDGNISSSIQWTSDLDGAIGTGSSFNKNNLSVGTHVITAEVIDNESESNTDEITITVSPIVEVSDVNFSANTFGNKRWTGEVIITVLSIGGSIENANVQGTWSTGFSDTCTTNSDGICLVSERTKDSTLTFTIDDISGAGIEYDTSRNDSVTLDKNGIIGEDTTAPTTAASPSGGTYTSSQQVTLSANEDATIYYTTNGSDPTTSSSEYSSPISIATNTTLKFFAVDTAGNAETIKTEEYIINETTQDILVHVGSLDGILTTKGPWNTFSVTITVHDNNIPTHNLQSGVTVTGSWSDGLGSETCTTDGNGQCSVSVRSKSVDSVEFTVDSLDGDGFAYDLGSNEITTITIP